MKLIYVAGKYNDSTPYRIEQNVRAAEDVALQIAETRQFSAICPHTQSRNFAGTVDEEYWIKATMAQMEVCAGVVLVGGMYEWQSSPGTMGELKRAFDMGIPVYSSAFDLVNNLPLTENFFRCLGISK